MLRIILPCLSYFVLAMWRSPCKLRARTMLSELGALRACKRDEWKRRIKAALKDASENRTEAAITLGVSYRHLTRWLKEIGYFPRVNQHDAQSCHSVDTSVIAKRPRIRKCRDSRVIAQR